MYVYIIMYICYSSSVRQHIHKWKSVYITRSASRIRSCDCSFRCCRWAVSSTLENLDLSYQLMLIIIIHTWCIYNFLQSEVAMYSVHNYYIATYTYMYICTCTAHAYLCMHVRNCAQLPNCVILHIEVEIYTKVCRYISLLDHNNWWC